MSQITVKDVVVRKPTENEKQTCSAWPVWTCQASSFDWQYTEKETCLIIEGEVTVSDDKNSVSFGPGDLVIFPNGLGCKWNIKKAVKKYYNFG
jgi:uncharacterized cupin superfamily protein